MDSQELINSSVFLIIMHSCGKMCFATDLLTGLIITRGKGKNSLQSRFGLAGNLIGEKDVGKEYVRNKVDKAEKRNTCLTSLQFKFYGFPSTFFSVVSAKGDNFCDFMLLPWPRFMLA